MSQNINESQWNYEENGLKSKKSRNKLQTRASMGISTSFTKTRLRNSHRSSTMAFQTKRDDEVLYEASPKAPSRVAKKPMSRLFSKQF